MIKTMMAAGSRAVFGAHIVGSIPTVFIIYFFVFYSPRIILAKSLLSL